MMSPHIGVKKLLFPICDDTTYFTWSCECGHLTSTVHVKNAQYTVLLTLTRLLFTVCKLHASDVIILGRNYTTLLFCTSASQLFYFTYQ